MGSDRSQAVAGYDGAGPRVLGKFSSRYGTPIAVNLLTGVLATLAMALAFAFAGGNLDKYFNAVLTNALLFTTLAYVVIFPAVIRLRYTHPNAHRPYRVPFGNPGVWVCGGLPTLWALFASLVGLFPGLGDGMLLNDRALPKGFTRGEFQLVVFVPVLLTLVTGVWFYVMGRRTREEVVPASPIPGASDTPRV
jgi:amino acid transporter